MQRSSARIVLALTGVALIIGFFSPWLDLGGLIRGTGWDAVNRDGLSGTTRVLFALVPVAGLGLVLTSLAGVGASKGLAILTGVCILGYSLFQVVYYFFKMSGFGLWLVLAAAVMALVAGLATRGRE